MANLLKKKILKITTWIKSNPFVVEPNMREFMDVIIEISNASSREKEDCLEAFSEMYASRFGNDKCPDMSNTAMWKLFRTVTEAVIKDDYKVDDKVEKDLLLLLMEIGSSCFQKNKWDDEMQRKSIEDLLEKYSLGSFFDEAEMAFNELNHFSLFSHI